MSVLTDVYPPLTPVSVMPLHPEGRRGPGQWWACAHPSVRRSSRVVFDHRCKDCIDYMARSIETQGDREYLWWRDERDTTPTPVLLSWLVARSRTLGVA